MTWTWSEAVRHEREEIPVKLVDFFSSQSLNIIPDLPNIGFKWRVSISQPLFAIVTVEPT